MNTIYGNRDILGTRGWNTDDGWNYRGRGLKQLTVRYKYTAFNTWHATNQSRWPNDIIDAVSNPNLLLDIKHATRSAAFFWLNNRSKANPNRAAYCYDYTNEASDIAVNRITNIVNYQTNSRQARINNFWRLWNSKALF